MSGVNMVSVCQCAIPFQDQTILIKSPLPETNIVYITIPYLYNNHLDEKLLYFHDITMTHLK